MEARKSNNEIPSPVLLRRRLSAPETIMRKHVLALQRSDSQESETRGRQWRSEMEAGSDSNLSGRRDPDIMRKSTLLRRLWSNNKRSLGSRFSGSFSEWQHSLGKLSSGKSTHSLTSIHSSPSSPLRKISPKHLPKLTNSSNNNSSNLISTPKRKTSIYDGNYESYTSYFSDETSTSIMNRNFVSTATSITPKTITETTTRTSNTSFSDNSDSAYALSNFSNNNSTPSSEIHKRIVEQPEVTNKDSTNNGNNLLGEVTKLKDSARYSPANSSVHESATQTQENTNVNVISNVQLSQSTLDLIFNQVMQDVKKASVSDESNKVVTVHQVPSFYLKSQEEREGAQSQHSQIVKYMISNVGTGSPYSRPAEVPQLVVPRFSALPRTTSMEVNISSGDSTDKESDTISLADSLEDSNLLKSNDKNTRKELFLPDNSNILNKNKAQNKPTAFFIPIEDQTEFKAVSDHLPEKVRLKLAKRQEKLLANKSNKSSPRSDSNYVSASDNGNHIFLNRGSNEINHNRNKKRNKPLLPSIKTVRRINIDKDDKIKSVKRKSVETSYKNSKQRMPNIKSKEKLSPIYTTKSEYVYDYEGPRKIYHKTEFNNSNKRIEILEIMECLESSDKLSRQLMMAKSKSKIPVLINKVPRIDKNKIKPTFLDLDCAHLDDDPKFDQLIANILMETLNSPNVEASASASIGSKKAESSPKFQQKFEVIPEELSASAGEDRQKFDSDNDNINNNADSDDYKGRAAVAVVRDDNFSSIPKGWITFYMLHKNRSSPESTSDEGKNPSDCAKNTNNIASKDNNNENNNVAKKEDVSSCIHSDNTNSSNEKRHHKYHQKRQKAKSSKDLGEWSVTVSGTNTYGQFAPDLEMFLKFPEASKAKNQHFPQIMKPQKVKRNEEFNENYSNQRLPDISKNQNSTRRKPIRGDSGPPPSVLGPPKLMEPRQTRTSLRRYNLTRPRIEYDHHNNHNQHQEIPSENPFDFLDERHYAEILRHLPEILTITGNSLSPDKNRDSFR